MANIRIALVGNPNSGKTTLFNAFTGAHRRVGNYPGTTVERQQREVERHGQHAVVTDLPGTYSLSAYTQEERVTRREIAQGKPDVVVDVLNAGVLERNLYLAVQILELGVPLVLGLNMMDEARKKGLRVDAARLAELLGVPVHETVARTDTGVDDLMYAAIDRALERRGQAWIPLRISYGPDLDPVLEEMEHAIQAADFLTQDYPARWVAIKYLEGDADIIAQGRRAGALGLELEQMVDALAEHLDSGLKTTPEARLADYRYGYINSLLRQGVVTREEEDRERHLEFSERLDSVLTHRVLGPAIMLAILYMTYQIGFSLGEVPMRWVEGFFKWLGGSVFSVMPEGLTRSLLVDGIIAGVGGVMSFVPLIICMFLCVAFMEDSGYMARVAYMLDRLFRMFGLHGSSVMPYIISGGIPGGCAVPGILAARTLRTTRERIATILTAPFMVCGAKVPVLLLLTTAFFAGREGIVMFGITLAGWSAALLSALLLRNTLLRGAATPFVMELPPYRMPTLWGLLFHTWLRAWEYIKKAGTVILAISVLMWACITLPELPQETPQATGGALAGTEKEDAASRAATKQAALQHSFAGRVGMALEPAGRLAGFDWQTTVALLGGFAAKEVIVSTLGIAYSLGEVEKEDTGSLRGRLNRDPAWNKARALAMMFFVMLYAPCLVTVVVIRRETGSWGWAILSIAFNTLLAFGVAVAVYQAGNLF
ncbi:MAG: ferrous iron transport protein B [Desulfovibrionaceae bacterium]|nr:ferrous iron transport protein B [Desulfovibrionaceae bacterium]MCL2123265.1 ferrous iron transport protein B [Desulfovibrionaceae bacterium]